MSCHLSFETLKIFLLTTVSHRNNVDDINTYIHTYIHIQNQEFQNIFSKSKSISRIIMISFQIQIQNQ